MTVVASEIRKPRRLKEFVRRRKRSKKSSTCAQWVKKPRGWMKTHQEMKEHQVNLGQSVISLTVRMKLILKITWWSVTCYGYNKGLKA